MSNKARIKVFQPKMLSYANHINLTGERTDDSDFYTIKISLSFSNKVLTGGNVDTT